MSVFVLYVRNVDSPFLVEMYRIVLSSSHIEEDAVVSVTIAFAKVFGRVGEEVETAGAGISCRRSMCFE